MRYILFIAFTVATLLAHAQAQKGNIVDGESLNPLYQATIINTVTHRVVETDAQGNFSIQADAGDSLSFSYPGYHIVTRPVNLNTNLPVELFPLTVKLKEYTVHDYTPYQRDSIEMATRYSSELNKKAVTTGFSNANGGGFTGLIGGPVQKMSRSYKQNKRFKKNFQKDMEQKYIDTRYTPALVSILTKLSGDSLIMFMNTHPMDYSFARVATDLEVKVWIRDNYKDYMAKNAQQQNATSIPVTPVDTLKTQK